MKISAATCSPPIFLWKEAPTTPRSVLPQSRRTAAILRCSTATADLCRSPPPLRWKRLSRHESNRLPGCPSLPSPIFLPCTLSDDPALSDSTCQILRLISPHPGGQDPINECHATLRFLKTFKTNVQRPDFIHSSHCVECISAAQDQIRNCSNLSGGTVIYDACFLRYESYNFYANANANAHAHTDDEYSQLCGRQSIEMYHHYAFSADTKTLLSLLCTATPETSNLFAAQSQNEFMRGYSNTTMYGVAWCSKSVRKEGCRDCLSTAESVIDACLSQSEGRAVAAGWSLRYATYPFSSHKDATDLSKFLPKSGSTISRIVFALFWAVIAFALLAVIVSSLVSSFRNDSGQSEW